MQIKHAKVSSLLCLFVCVPEREGGKLENWPGQVFSCVFYPLIEISIEMASINDFQYIPVVIEEACLAVIYIPFL